MAQLAGERSSEIEKKKLALADDRFDVAAEKIEEEHVPEQMPRAIVKKRGRDKLPAVSGTQALVAQREILANKSRLIGVEEKLGDKNRDVRADQSKKNDSRTPDPTPGGPRRLSAGEVHVPEAIATKIPCRWILCRGGHRTPLPQQQ